MVLVAGCYQPTAELPCTVTCGLANLCPGELTCDTSDHVCKRNGSCDPSPTDAHGADVPDLPGDELGLSCFGHDDGLGQICLTRVPSGAFVAPSGTTIINTDIDARCQVDPLITGNVCVIAQEGIIISSGGVVRAHGTKPLVLIGASFINIDGLIDVSSSSPSGTGPGAGGDFPQCGFGVLPTNLGGGAGGSFMATGAFGGNGDNKGVGAGSPTPTASVLALRGGCTGQTGDGPMGIAGGSGGGAVYLLSHGNVTLGQTGGINASGAGGPGGGNSRGGNGGGSGGLIGIDANLITDAGGFLLANGGGGGCGGSSSDLGGPAANPSHNGIPSGCTGSPAAGGTGGYFTSFATAGAQGLQMAGGGGGGGAVGVIYLRPTGSTIADRSP